MKILDIKDRKGKRVILNADQIKKIEEYKDGAIIYFSQDIYMITKLSLNELHNKLISL
ncbi:hypothetical protein R3X25_02225 [Lutibacter sp. TH_r2]|uniref:hypothetical protein n=1 Tax=Lutibacter sp. TH_r2 TaxID=3082083 RepID=UPI0029542EFC|nr:hypothetical protein [Lutibacter sp. TH_r2]MDV7186085.1 hypothetical protein [Lutibacter sp. TH_r2]